MAGVVSDNSSPTFPGTFSVQTFEPISSGLYPGLDVDPILKQCLVSLISCVSI